MADEALTALNVLEKEAAPFIGATQLTSDCSSHLNGLPANRKNLNALEESKYYSRPWDALWFLTCALASSVWCLTAAANLGATFDEPFYVTQGLEFWRTGSHAGLLEVGTMPLPVDLETFSLFVWERVRGVPFDTDFSIDIAKPPRTLAAMDLEHLLPMARAGTLIFWWMLLIYGWLIGFHLVGAWGARLAVAWLAFEPNLLAHASLATTDIAASASLLALLYHFRTGREDGWFPRVGLPAFWFAVAVLAKASNLFFGPYCLLMVELVRIARKSSVLVTLRRSREDLQPFGQDLVQILIIGLGVVFLYCGTDWQPKANFVAWAHTLHGPFAPAMVWVSEHLRIFPNAGQGLMRQMYHNLTGHGVYLLGHTAYRAVWYYFPVLMTIKASVPVLLMPVILAVLRPRALANWAILAATALLAFSLTFRVQIGIRLILPLLALAIVGLSAATVQAWRESPSGWKRHVIASAAVVALTWTIGSAAAVWPNGLAYINELWGGTSRGYLLVSDSNYDWGQGLKELARWQEDKGLSSLQLWYFGTDPAVKRLPLRVLRLDEFDLRGPEDVKAVVDGQYLAVSITLLYGSYTVTDKLHQEARRQAVAFLRSQRPIARTTTFFIYDFTPHPRGVQ